MENILDGYIDDLSQTIEFKRLIELKSIIDEKYKNLIIKFKTKESLYLDAKKYGEYYPELNSIQNDFMKAKKDLYEKEEVKEYLKLERIIQDKLNSDINLIKSSVSNKFKLTKNIIF
ncbi:MAG: hypothetical protein ACI35S_02090 [Anaeroplasma sp.]